MPTISVPMGPSKDLEGVCKQIKIPHDGLKKQAVVTHRQFLQMVDQMAQLAGSVEQTESLLRPVPTAPESWNGPSVEGHPIA